MRTVVGIAIAGAIGALARYGLEGLVSQKTPASFPWGTFVVNVTGAFVVGFLFVLFAERFAVAPWLRSSLLIGLIGGYTTFSTLALETYRLIEDGALPLAAANGFGSVAAGMLAVYAGIVAGRAL
jgi:fluoride exporter